MKFIRMSLVLMAACATMSPVLASNARLNQLRNNLAYVQQNTPQSRNIIAGLQREIASLEGTQKRSVGMPAQLPAGPAERLGYGRRAWNWLNNHRLETALSALAAAGLLDFGVGMARHSKMTPWAERKYSRVLPHSWGAAAGNSWANRSAASGSSPVAID